MDEATYPAGRKRSRQGNKTGVMARGLEYPWPGERTAANLEQEGGDGDRAWFLLFNGIFVF